MLPSYLLITLDSCRFDVLAGARTPAMSSRGSVLEALSPASYTYPAHLSIFQGMTPDCRRPFPFYNRYVTQLWRCPLRLGAAAHTPEGVSEDERPPREHPFPFFFCRVPGGSKNVPFGLAAMGYRTIGAGAMRWMGHPWLKKGFDVFRFTGVGVDRQIAFAREEIDRAGEQPVYLFLNLGETHAPYVFGDDLAPARAAPLMAEYLRLKHEQRPDPAYTTCFPYFDRQRAAVEHLDAQLEGLFSHLSARYPSTVVMICGDHGEAMGEDNLWGHAFTHPKVMSVPLFVFEMGRERVLAPLHACADRIAEASRREIAASLAEERLLRSPDHRRERGLLVREL
jgi:Sulfatase